MALIINDKQVDEQLDQIVNKIKNDFGIKNCSRADAIRWLLQIRRQGHKTSRKWQKTF